MALIAPEQYKRSLKNRKPKIFMNGKKVEDYLNNPNIRTVIESNKASYQWALDPQYQEIMTAISPLTKDRVNRYLYVCRSREDLVARLLQEPLRLKDWGPVSTGVRGWMPFILLPVRPGRSIRILKQNIMVDSTNTLDGFTKMTLSFREP